jgi:hypothetical protein
MSDHDRSTSSNPMPRHDEDEDAERESAQAELGGAYGDDDPPMPTSTAETLGNPPRGEARYETKFENAEEAEDDR